MKLITHEHYISARALGGVTGVTLFITIECFINSYKKRMLNFPIWDMILEVSHFSGKLYIPSARPRGGGETPVVVNTAYNLREEVLALRAAPENTDDEQLDIQLEIGKLFKGIVIFMLSF